MHAHRVNETLSIPFRHLVELEIPRDLRGLYDLAFNLWWSWRPEARALFSSVEPSIWAQYRNPVELLIGIEPQRWELLLQSEAFLHSYHAVLRQFRAYMENEESTWFNHQRPECEGNPVAYFSMEYGVHHSLSIYSGGLGILSGDHLKSASDLGIPLVAVGLLYRHGYFHQTLDAEGNQQHSYPRYDFGRIPLRPVASYTGGDLVVQVPFPDREVHARLWLAQVGRVPLLLLDTDIQQNHPADRPITNTLYIRGREIRLAQELVLGVGGARALRALDISPAVWHLNEGHSALAQIERLAGYMERQGKTWDEAMERLRETTVFTTHTPIPAGNEEFARDLTARHLLPFSSRLQVPVDDLLALGHGDHGDPNQPFNMTAIVLRTSGFVNGVSKIHGDVSRRMWQHIFPDCPLEEVPIQSITNGVHLRTWGGWEFQELLRRHLGVGWQSRIHFPDGEDLVRQIPEREVWEMHQAQKARLGRFMRSRIRDQFARHGRSPEELRVVDRLFRTEVLTIGFARRFATYKRANLLFSDLHQLRQLVAHPERPVQIVLAGKAHPADRGGQDLIRHIFQLSQSDPLAGRVFFLEDYDMRLARMLVQGCDVWLNAPTPPLEASGTSGQKAALNGCLNCSIPDGWWPEAADGTNGWSFGADVGIEDHERRDLADAQSLYRVLEEEVIPTYYDKDENGVPIEWAQMMRHSIASIGSVFSSDRMVREYAEKAYLPLVPPAPTQDEN